ncbi:hypothetical protein IJI69_00380 [Candidatus Saccharibacteria bacterium]|nr:hypothetical protein [Candidatus Saccharibacteria bacterium]MBQ6127145.1 hypothetical protein [Candidatus Saccharibacteria bacterium]
MTFLFDCKDEVSLPAAYKLVAEEIKPYLEKLKTVEVEDSKIKDKKEALSTVLEKMMVEYPKETSELFAKLWVLDKGEEAPNVWKTMATLFKSEVAIDFFTSVLPSLLQISKIVSVK